MAGIGKKDIVNSSREIFSYEKKTFSWKELYNHDRYDITNRYFT